MIVSLFQGGIQNFFIPYQRENRSLLSEAAGESSWIRRSLYSLYLADDINVAFLPFYIFQEPYSFIKTTTPSQKYWTNCILNKVVELKSGIKVNGKLIFKSYSRPTSKIFHKRIRPNKSNKTKYHPISLFSFTSQN